MWLGELCDFICTGAVILVLKLVDYDLGTES